MAALEEGLADRDAARRGEAERAPILGGPANLPDHPVDVLACILLGHSLGDSH